jgi:hypothetical protein
MIKYLNKKVKFTADYMNGDYEIETLHSIVDDKEEFNEPYFINKTNDRFFTLSYVKKKLN